MYPAISKSFIFFLIAIIISVSGAEVQAQADGDIESLQRQLKQLQSKISNIQTDSDPFGNRVRSVGRQRTVKPEPAPDELVIRFYDLSDVFSIAPQYQAQTPTDFHSHSAPLFPIAVAGTSGRMSGGGFGGGGGGVFSFPSGPVGQRSQPTSVQAARVSVEALVGAVKQTVSPEEWEDTDGDASISILGNTLLISATEQMHEQIANLMDLFREQWGKLKTVAVEAYWIEATSSEITVLLESDLENPVVGKVNDKKWNQFFSKAGEAKRIAYSASMCGQNGQTLHAVSGRRHFVVLDATPMYSSEGKREAVEDENVEYINRTIAGLHPVRSVFHEGAALQASPMATRGGKFVILDLHTRVNEYVDTGTEATKIVAQGKQEQPLSLDLESKPYVSYRLSTTVRCPNNSIVLAGGMTYDSSQETDQPNLYLFVKTAIHTIEEDLVVREKDKK